MPLRFRTIPQADTGIILAMGICRIMEISRRKCLLTVAMLEETDLVVDWVTRQLRMFLRQEAASAAQRVVVVVPPAVAEADGGNRPANTI